MFWRFLRFGALAWGGPVAQIGLMHRELVQRHAWVDEATFRRVFGVYQALPGPEATELAVYFGYQRAGRLGGFLSGLGFVLPGFVLTLLVAEIYLELGADAPGLRGLLYAIKPITIALILHALLRLGRTAITSDGLGLVALTAFLLGAVMGWNFILIMILLGLAYFGARGHRRLAGAPTPLLFALPALPFPILFLGVFLAAGLVTFGGAYTVIPLLQQWAVEDYAWITQEQFLDAIALSSLLPAPMIMVACFIGQVVWPPWGGLLATVAIFLPAFAFTLLFHERLVRLVEDHRTHDLFDGLTAAVVGLIGLTLVRLFPTAVPDLVSVGLAAAAFLLLRLLRWNVVSVVAAGAAAGLVLEALGRVPL
jgi:chromate transporter